MLSGYNLLDVCKTAMNYDQSKRYLLYAYIGFCVAQLSFSYYSFSKAREEKKVILMKAASKNITVI